MTTDPAASRHRLARQLLDRITSDTAMLRALLLHTSREAPPDPAAEIEAEMRERAADLGIVIDAAGRVALPDAARLAGCSARTLTRWRESGDLPAAIMNRRPRFGLADLARKLAGEPDIS
ncbi:helix-turn-helix domain-containing protein [Amaricoccus solimangrovi]|uniref:Helix-turn-helix domain-containing protein n=1 Tax=Amaricoccus solimangrovi TaxID=2589815 RepID=A0A501X0I1_9RHOB|nr:helix-turn-helix domain-containing protein [Amaricoccus solimangrovi]TPE53221.1 helix-turn-helix domain-containing protein [Amaricoccus solimangrovi]